MLKLTQRHGSPNYYLRGTVRGISVDESTGINIGSQRAANEYKTRREAELLDESIHGKRAVAKFSEAVVSYISGGGEARYMESIAKHFGDTKLAKIGQHEIDAGAAKLFPTQSDATRRRHYYVPVSAVLRHAAKLGWFTPFPLVRPSDGKPRVRWLTHEEADKLIAACNHNLRPLVIFLLYTGARIGEAVWLDWKDVDLDRRHVQFIDTKTDVSRGVPLHSKVVDALRMTNDRTGHVFRSLYGTPYGASSNEAGARKKLRAGDYMRGGFNSAVKRAGLTDFHPHDCRHTWATWHYQANRDLGALQKLGGWRTLEMVMRYSHTNVSELDATIDRMK